MAIDINNTSRTQPLEKQKRVTDIMQLYSKLQEDRVVFSEQYEEVASLIFPELRNTFMYQSYVYPGTKLTQRQLDSTGMQALNKFATIVQSLLTPSDSEWHSLTTTNPYLNKNRRVALWFEQATKVLFSHRYAPTANFQGQIYACYKQLGAFGTMGMFIDELYDPILGRQGLRYKAINLGELYLIENHQGQVDGFMRYFKMTAHQALSMFGEDNFPPALTTPLVQGSQYLYDFIQYVHHREDFDPRRKDKQGMPWASEYVSITGQWFCKEGGYRTFPLAVGRYSQGPREVYGRSPAMAVLPSLKTINEIKGMALKVGHRTADPVLLVYDDAQIDGVSLLPGALNKGGVDQQGRPLVHTLPVGNLQLGIELMDREGAIVKDEMLISLFDILTEQPEMTATQVIERVQEKGTLLAPMVGRQSEFLGPEIDRELDILYHMKKLPPMPRELIEAKGEYSVEYTSPLNRYMRAGELVGISRSIEFAQSWIQGGGDPAILDKFNFDNIIDLYVDVQGVPPSCVNDDATVKALRKQRAQAMQQQQQIQAMPGQSAMIKAQAVMTKVQAEVGGGQGGPPPSGPPGEGQGGMPPGQQGQGAPPQQMQQ